MGNEILELCPRPSFFEGIARLFDFSGTLDHYNYSETGDEADYRAILSDWQHVGYEISRATESFARAYIKGTDGQIT
jgi:hypothetical protein